MALPSTPPPYPVFNSNFLEPCFAGNAALSSSAVGETVSASLGASYFGSQNLKKAKVDLTFQISSSLEAATSGSNILLALNLNNSEHDSGGGTNYTQSLELQYLAATLTGSELSFCTSLFDQAQP